MVAPIFRGWRTFNESIILDGVVKTPVYVVVAGLVNARRTLCTPALNQHHYAYYTEVLYLAILANKSSFYEIIILDGTHTGIGFFHDRFVVLKSLTDMIFFWHTADTLLVL